MRVVFDGFWWNDGPISNRSVQKAIIRTWGECFPDDELFVVVPATPGQPLHGDLLPSVHFLRGRPVRHPIFNGFIVPRAAKRVSADVVVSHNFASPYPNSVVFIHDLMFMDNPEWFTRTENVYFRLMLPMSRFASSIATSSHNEAVRISRFVRRQVSSTGLAVPLDLSEAQPSRPSLAPPSDDFALIVGRLTVRKNLAMALKAFLARAEGSSPQTIVVVGERSSAVDPALARILNEASEGSVKWMSRVESSELLWLYRNARLVVVPSLDEGFGLPVLEALTLGKRLVANDVGVLREVAGDVGVFADASDLRAFSAALVAGAEANRVSDAQRRELAERYSWKRVVESLRLEAEGGAQW